MSALSVGADGVLLAWRKTRVLPAQNIASIRSSLGIQEILQKKSLLLPDLLLSA